ncbi:MAG: hypothetical protein WCC04_06950 [Terriglobales bacterium]
MEDLFEIVAASLARYGIDCPDAVSRTLAARPTSPEVTDAPAFGVLEKSTVSTKPSAAPAALPEHSYRQKLESDPAP